MDENDLEGLSMYQDIIDEVLAGRLEGHRCPYCKEGVLECYSDEVIIEIKCPSCGKFFEGRLA